MTQNTNNPNQYFKNQLNSDTNTLQKVKSKSRTISIIRILVFLVTVVGIYFCVANGYEIAAMLFTLGFILFIYLVKIHASLEKKRKFKNFSHIGFSKTGFQSSLSILVFTLSLESGLDLQQRQPR